MRRNENSEVNSYYVHGSFLVQYKTVCLESSLFETRERLFWVELVQSVDEIQV